MDPFDPAINYGPNDAGISTFSIILIVLGLFFSSWLFGVIYAFIADKLNNKK